MAILTEDEELKKVGLKVTLPRLRILEVLEDSSESHKSAEGIYKELIASNEDIEIGRAHV